MSRLSDSSKLVQFGQKIDFTEVFSNSDFDIVLHTMSIKVDQVFYELQFI